MAKKSKPTSKTPPSMSRREALRLQQEAEDKRKRQMKMLTIGALVFGLVVVIAVVAIVVGNIRAEKAKSANKGDFTAQVVPLNATDDKSGIVINPGKATDGAPLVERHADYQCGGCITYEAFFGDTLRALADKGEINYVAHQRIFMDRNIGNDTSTRGAIAAACADMVGRYEAYDAAVWKAAANATKRGFTDEQLRETFAQEAGLTGSDLETFQQCYNARATSEFVAGVDAAASARGINNTPTFLVNGTEIDLSKATNTEESVMAVINAAKG